MAIGAGRRDKGLQHGDDGIVGRKRQAVAPDARA